MISKTNVGKKEKAENAWRADSPDLCSVFSLDPVRVESARRAMPSQELADEIASTFKALSHPTRVRILSALAVGTLCVCELSETVGLSVSATSHQLSLLKRQKLVKSRAEGKLVHYSLGDCFVLGLLNECRNRLSEERFV